MKADRAMTSAIALSISCLIVRYWACRSTKGIFMTEGGGRRSEVGSQKSETEDRDQTSDVGGPRTEERCVISDLSQQKSAVTGQTSEGKKKDCLPYFRAWLRSRDIPHSILHDLVSPNNRTHRRNLANCQSHHSLRRHP